MNRQRQLIWLGLLGLVLAIRWWDPLGRPTAIQAASAPVERASGVQMVTPPQAPAQTSTPAAWPLRAEMQDTELANAFMARSQVPAPVVKPTRVVAPPPVVYTPPPPPPPPVENPPPLQVIGTWGDDANLAVFLSGPQGTLLARPGDVLLSDYRVQSITKQQLTLLQNSNQRSWNLNIPTAPSALQTWPGR